MQLSSGYNKMHEYHSYRDRISNNFFREKARKESKKTNFLN